MTEIKENASVMITTMDNPYDPFTQWDEWSAFDLSHGYNSWNKVARLAKISDHNTDEDNERAITDAIYRLVDLDPIGEYRACTREEFAR